MASMAQQATNTTLSLSQGAGSSKRATRHVGQRLSVAKLGFEPKSFSQHSAQMVAEQRSRIGASVGSEQLVDVAWTPGWRPARSRGRRRNSL